MECEKDIEKLVMETFAALQIIWVVFYKNLGPKNLYCHVNLF